MFVCAREPFLPHPGGRRGSARGARALMDPRNLAEDLLRQTRAAGADAADVIILTQTSFGVTVRKGEVETLEHAVGKDVGLRVLVGRRTALSRSSDFSREALQALVRETVDLA